MTPVVLKIKNPCSSNEIGERIINLDHVVKIEADDEWFTNLYLTNGEIISVDPSYKALKSEIEMLMYSEIVTLG